MEQTIEGGKGDMTHKGVVLTTVSQALTVSELLHIVIEHGLLECALVVGADGVRVAIRAMFASTGDAEGAR